MRAHHLDDLGDVAYTKELVSIEELALAIVREIGCENAVRSTLSALVLACSASLRGAAAISCCGDSVGGDGGGGCGGVVIGVHGLLGRNKKRGVRFRLHLRRGRCLKVGPFLGLGFSLPLFSRLCLNSEQWEMERNGRNDR